MPRYIDWADVASAYRSIRTDVDEVEGNKFCVRAEDQVDSRLATVYTVPFVPGSSNVPGAVRDICIDLAYYKLAWRQEGMDALYTSIEDRLKAIIEGKTLLVNSDGVLPGGAGLEAWTDRPFASSFGPDDPTNWHISSVWQADAIGRRE